MSRSIQGSWTLVSLEYRRDDGEVLHPMGADALGWITYGADGRMAVQLMKADRPRFSTEAFTGGTPQEKLSAYDGYLAYLGTYTVDDGDRCVIHRIEGSLFPNWIGTTQKRYFEFEGSRLILRSEPLLAQGGPIVAFAIWERQG